MGLIIKQITLKSTVFITFCLLSQAKGMDIKMKEMIENIFNNWNTQHDFSGVFSVRKEKDKIFEKSCGYMNQSLQIQNNIHTKFGIASGTKIFTAVAICKLIEMEKLHLNDKVLDLLEFSFPNFNKVISVMNLLNHTSGVPDYFDEEVSNDYESTWENRPVYKMIDLKDYLPMFQSGNMKFEPGTRYSYSNAGYILLGLIIEKISGQTYQDFVMENIIKPCGMKNTGFYRNDMIPENTALGYIYDDNLKYFRTNMVGVFPSMDSYIRLVTSYLIEYSEDWSTSRAYVDSKVLNQIAADLHTAA